MSAAWRRGLRIALGAAGLLLTALALTRLEATRAGLVVEHAALGPTPIAVFRAADAPPGPAVVIAHGFAGSRQLMSAFATTLAQAGYLAVTFDFAGHGRNAEPMRGDVDRLDGVTRQLVAEIAQVAAFARAHPAGDGRLALLGHSMASDLIVRAAIADGAVTATVAVSMFSPAVTAAAPADLLVITGAYEAALRAEALRAVGLALPQGETAREGVTYGVIGSGGARRAVAAAGVEHVGVLYARDGLAEARAWLDAAFGRTPSGAAPPLYGPWALALLLGAAVALWAAAALAPQLAEPPAGAGLGWRNGILVLGPPALLTPILLWPLPTGFLPILVGDYLAAHFALYGLLTLCGLWMARRRAAPVVWPRLGRLALAAAAALALLAVLVAAPLDRHVVNFALSEARAPFFFAAAAGALVYFLADGWASGGLRPDGRRAPRGLALLSKVGFLASLGLAVALDFERLFFLVMIIPVVLLFFLAFGALAGALTRRSGHPALASVVQAIAFAWAIAATFPLFVG